MTLDQKSKVRGELLRLPWEQRDLHLERSGGQAGAHNFRRAEWRTVSRVSSEMGNGAGLSALEPGLYSVCAGNSPERCVSYSFHLALWLCTWEKRQKNREFILTHCLRLQVYHVPLQLTLVGNSFPDRPSNVSPRRLQIQACWHWRLTIMSQGKIFANHMWNL